MKKIVFSIILLLGFCLFSGTVFGETILEQPLSNTVESGSFDLKLGQTFILNSDVILETVHVEHCERSYGNLVLEIWNVESGFPTGSAIASSTFGAKSYGVCTDVWQSFALTPLELFAGAYAYTFDDFAESTGISMRVKTDNPYADGKSVHDENSNGTTWASANPNNDFKFKLTGSLPGPTVSIFRPQEEQVIYSTDPIVIVEYNFEGEETEGLFDLEVRLGDATTTIIEQQQSIIGEYGNISFWLNDSYYDASEVIRGQATTTVIMYVDLWDTAETELYAQASSTFTILNQFFIIEGIGTTTDVFFVDCSIYGEAGFFSSTTITRIGCEAKKVIYDFAGFMILPQEWASNLFGGSFEALKSKFPFSVVYSLTSAVGSGAETASESTTTAPIILTFPENTPLTLEIIGTSTLAGAGAVKDIVFEGIEYILWAVLGIMIIKLII